MDSVKLPPWKVEALYDTGPLAETVDWGLALYGVPDAWKQTEGAGVKVAVLDTGIDEAHEDLKEAIAAATDFTGGRTGPADAQGHGTHTAGTIAARKNSQGVVGVAPAASLLIGKVLDDAGQGDNRWVAAGVEWAIRQGADIISMSLGSPFPSSGLLAVIRAAAAAGKFVVCAAGNDGRDNSVNYPAKWPETVAVGAVDRNGRVTSFSSRGPEIAVAAPGQDVLSTWPGNRYAKLSGTSMACPFVAGVVALMVAKHRAAGGATPVKTVEDLKAHLAKTATDAGPQGRDPSYGYGLINPASMLGPAEAPPAAKVRLWHLDTEIVMAGGEAKPVRITCEER